MKSEKIELIQVGASAMVVPDSKTVETLQQIKEHLVKQHISEREYGENVEMINALEYAVCILDSARKQFNAHKDESIKIQKIIKSCGGFITFKEWLGLITSDSNWTEYQEILSAVARDDSFPINKDASWKSYRMLLKYIIKKYSIWFWDDFKQLYYEYRNIIERRYFP
jgi:hypothetical protein